MAGDVDRAGWWGAGRRANWADAIAAAHVVADAARTVLTVTAADHPPWHPGRCAQLRLDGVVVGYAGELHPRAIAALELPERTAAMEIDLDAFAAPAPVAAASISAFPPVLIDLALVLDADVASSAVLAAVTEGAGELLESIRLFDCYADDQRLGVGLKSLAFALRLRAPDRTLTSEHAVAIRDSALARAAELFGARLRS